MTSKAAQVETIHIVDDDLDVRQALGSLLRSAGLHCQLHADSDSFLRAYDNLQPSCLLLDVRLVREDGLEVQEALSQQKIAIPVIIMTGHGDINMAIRGMKNGAIDFLLKPFTDEALLKAVEQAIDVSRSRIEILSFREKNLARWARLSPREQEVLRLGVHGLLNKQIAASLGIELVTVKVHRGRALRKLKVNTIAEVPAILAYIED